MNKLLRQRVGLALQATRHLACLRQILRRQKQRKAAIDTRDDRSRLVAWLFVGVAHSSLSDLHTSAASTHASLPQHLNQSVHAIRHGPHPYYLRYT